MLTNKRKIIVHLLSLAIIFGLYAIFEIRKPDCVDAQSCITIRPLIVQGSVTGSSGGGCGGTIANVSAPGTGNPWVGLTGWDLRYTSGDHHVDEMSVTIGTPTFSNTSVTFPVNACLNDGNNDDNFAWAASYIVVRWR